MRESEFEEWTRSHRRSDLPDFIEKGYIKSLTELTQNTSGILTELLLSGALTPDMTRGAPCEMWQLWPDAAVAGTKWHILPVKTFGRVLDTAKKFPILAQVLKEMGDVESAAFSRLRPHTTLRPHAGVELLAQKSLRVHLPLIVPGRATLTVGASTRELRVGQPLVFDEMQTHYAANEADADRITLLLDIARPEMFPFAPHPPTHWSLDPRNEVVHETQMISDFEKKLL